MNERGRRFTLGASGFLARVIQHELDHLDGVLFTDRLPERNRDRLLAQYEKRMRA
jgi:peptide deformylase